MARFTNIGMARKTFVASAAEEQAAQGTKSHSGDAAAERREDGGGGGEGQVEAGPSSSSKTPSSAAGGGGGSGEEKKKKKRRGRDRVKDEGGKRVPIGEKKGYDDGRKYNAKNPAPGAGTGAGAGGGWGRDEGIANRSKLSAEHGESRRQKRNDQKNANVTCFACRSVGHAARDCPNVLLAAAGGAEGGEGVEGGDIASTGASAGKRGMKRKAGKSGGELAGNKCYRCNATTHSLFGCPEPVDSSNPTPYATCYICIGSGHLASLCPSNPGRGIYVNGGSCKVCGSVAHRAKDCPDDKRGFKADANEEEGEGAGVKRRKGEVILGVGSGAGADEDDFMVVSQHDLKLKEKEKEDKALSKKLKKHLPARNGERPMKRLRDVGAEEGPGDRFGEAERAHQQAQEQGKVEEKEVESIPLTARNPTPQVQKVKSKAKVVSF